MSVTVDDSIKWWTAKRKTASVVAIIEGKTTVAEAAAAGELTIDGDPEALATMVSFLGKFEFWFDLVTP